MTGRLIALLAAALLAVALVPSTALAIEQFQTTYLSYNSVLDDYPQVSGDRVVRRGREGRTAARISRSSRTRRIRASRS